MDRSWCVWAVGQWGRRGPRATWPAEVVFHIPVEERKGRAPQRSFPLGHDSKGVRTSESDAIGLDGRER